MVFFAILVVAHKVLLMDLIGSGAFGRVHKAVWRGTLVAAKIIPVPATSSRVWENELAAYRFAVGLK